MFQNKVVWLDDTDPWLFRAKLDSARKKFADCDWVRYADDIYDSQSDAFKSLVSLLCLPPMFDAGRVVYCYGVPLKKSSAEFHAKLVKEFDKIPSNVCFILIARPDRGTILYKGVKALEEKKQAKAEEAFELNKSNAIDWIVAQASKLQLTIDKQACMMLADITNFSPAKIQNELIKLRWFAPDGAVSSRVVEMGASSPSRTDVKDLGDFILNHDSGSAHEYLQRLLDRGEPPIKICGFLQDWIMRLAIAQSGNCNFEAIRNDVTELKKWQSSEEDEESRYETVDDEKWGHFSRRKGESVPMFANPKSMFYPCDGLRRSGNPQGWAYDGLMRMYALQMALRAEDVDKTKVMHEFVATLISTGQKEEVSNAGNRDNDQ